MSANQDAPAIQRYNTRRAEGLYPELLRCVAVPRWARALVDGRPYGGVTELTAHAAELTEGLTEAEVLLALADHPKIGQRVNAGWSRTEQSGVDDRDARLAEALHAGNVAYEQRFGHIYLVCATGRSGAELLADLTARLANEPAAEIAVVRTELGKIAGLRLARVLAGPEPEQPESTERQA
ncbi:MAG TPA: 2-oxo-4-hydroxy-4-carboxy-5-ureidoimidazoline decarboxylase [Pseudonocardiaceae bacterium]|nr:2-oxo-4-hydroxy-4-carboxy-5-ureidoimidazoline decarboxylase [Pseudonocardiaceae bacterium]